MNCSYCGEHSGMEAVCYRKDCQDKAKLSGYEARLIAQSLTDPGLKSVSVGKAPAWEQSATLEIRMEPIPPDMIAKLQKVVFSDMEMYRKYTKDKPTLIAMVMKQLALVPLFEGGDFEDTMLRVAAMAMRAIKLHKILEASTMMPTQHGWWAHQGEFERKPGIQKKTLADLGVLQNGDEVRLDLQIESSLDGSQEVTPMNIIKIEKAPVPEPKVFGMFKKDHGWEIKEAESLKKAEESLPAELR